MLIITLSRILININTARRGDTNWTDTHLVRIWKASPVQAVRTVEDMPTHILMSTLETAMYMLIIMSLWKMVHDREDRRLVQAILKAMKWTLGRVGSESAVVSGIGIANVTEIGTGNSLCLVLALPHRRDRR